MSTSKGDGSGPTQVPRRHRLRVWWRSAQRWALASAIGVVLVLGTYGAHQYLAENHQPARLSDSLYMALQCFWVDSPAGGGSTGYPVAFQIARFLGPFVLVYAAIYTALRVFRRQLDRFTVKWHRDHLIICGFGPQGQALAEVALKHNMQIAVVDQAIDVHAEAVRHIRQIGGVPILIGDARRPETLKSAGVHKANQVVVLCGTDEENGQVVAAIEGAMESHESHRRSKLRVMVQVIDIELCERLELNELRFGPRNRSVDVDFECLPDLAAKYILGRFPLPEPPAEWPTVVIAGGGLMAEALLIAVAQKSLYYRFDVPPLVVVADEQSKAMVENVLRRHPRISTVLDVRCETTRECASLVRKGDELVYICLDDETRGVALGLSLQLAETRPRRTVVQTWARHCVLDVTARSQSGTSSIEHVGILEAMQDIDTVLSSVREQFAHAIHDDYRAGPHKSADGGLAWDDRKLDRRFKDQSRDQAATFENKLNEIGACIMPSLLIDDDSFTFTDVEIDALARSEHERWMQWEKADGYVFGPAPGPETRRNKEAKTHADLVDFEDLPWKEQEKDRDAIRRMPTVLRRANYGIVRRPVGEVSQVNRPTIDAMS